MNKLLLQQIIFFSTLVGIALAIFSLIPFIGKLGFLLLICGASIIVFIIMMKLNLIELSDVNESAIGGALAGFVSYLAFSITYIPVIIGLFKLFKYTDNYILAVTFSNAGFIMLTVLSIFMGVLSATTNSFFGVVTYYIKQAINPTTKIQDEQTEFKLHE